MATFNRAEFLALHKTSLAGLRLPTVQDMGNHREYARIVVAPGGEKFSAREVYIKICPEAYSLTLNFTFNFDGGEGHALLAGRATIVELLVDPVEWENGEKPLTFYLIREK